MFALCDDRFDATRIRPYLTALFTFETATLSEIVPHLVRLKAAILEAVPASRYDLFMSHASEDKDAIARPLYLALTQAGLSVWFDEAVLELGDSLRQKIDLGLALCRYGVVILSPAFFAKEWPQRELDGLIARETASGEKAILPIWHNIERRDILRVSPPLADRVGGRSSEGMAVLVAKIGRVLRRS